MFQEHILSQFIYENTMRKNPNKIWQNQIIKFINNTRIYCKGYLWLEVLDKLLCVVEN